MKNNGRMRTKFSTPQLARSIAPTAAVASGLMSPAALAAPGDLDAVFGDIGRAFLPDLSGPLWALEAESEAEDSWIAAGGDTFCNGRFYYCSDIDSRGFARRLTADSSIDASFAETALSATEVFDVALQPDGKVVAVGRSFAPAHPSLQVFRLETDGTLDAGFGEAGTFTYQPNAFENFS